MTVLEKIKSKCKVTSSGCWEWQKTITQRGRLMMMVNNKQTLAYRHAYEAAYGPFDESLQVMHKCDNKKCCNPEHLELGTNRDNALDYISKYGVKIGVKSERRPPGLEGQELINWIIESACVKKGDCYLWNRETSEDGYGRIRYKNKKYAVHRLIWALNNNFEELEGNIITHTCRVSNCCNPEHIILSTRADIMISKERPDRIESLDTIVEWLWLFEFCYNETGKKQYKKVIQGLRNLGLVKEDTKDDYVYDVLRGKSYKYLHKHFFAWTPTYT